MACETLIVWFTLDYFSDFLYLADILFHFRTGYLEDGVLQTDSGKLRAHYMNSTTFYIDCLCLLPLDFLYLSIGFNSILRSFRLVKIYRFWAFMDRTERHTNYPNLFRSTSLIHYLLVIFHWNGCLYHIIYKNNGFGSKNWVYHDTETADVHGPPYANYLSSTNNRPLTRVQLEKKNTNNLKIERERERNIAPRGLSSRALSTSSVARDDERSRARDYRHGL
ncbi:unnamed protein product [Plutella xylostella]|uniref:(diamondback moth) hypothetical protein n=1 Tax=Plutella xylostella TaxID=51655 RepID=A0A8S4DXM2_PLUXY|nr:unnamed protein product [Plutella xylostella]